MNIQNHSRIWMHCFRTLNLLMREQPFIYAFCCWMLHYFLTMHQDLLKVEQVSEEAESFRASLDKYMSRHQKRIQEAQDRAELLGRVNADSHVLRIFYDETKARESDCRSSRLLKESFCNRGFHSFEV